MWNSEIQLLTVNSECPLTPISTSLPGAEKMSSYSNNEIYFFLGMEVHIRNVYSFG